MIDEKKKCKNKKKRNVLSNFIRDDRGKIGRGWTDPLLVQDMK